jgi:uridylate kinase
MPTRPHFGRVLLKISGEGFCCPGSFGIEREPLDQVSAEIQSVVEMGVETAVVVGGGNFMRGASFSKDLGIDVATADYMGMLGTVLNALALQESLEARGMDTRVLSALSISRVCEPFIRRRAVRHLQKKRVVILAAGTGNPHVTTDSCAALRAAELKVNVLLKATRPSSTIASHTTRSSTSACGSWTSVRSTFASSMTCRSWCSIYSPPARCGASSKARNWARASPTERYRDHDQSRDRRSRL